RGGVAQSTRVVLVNQGGPGGKLAGSAGAGEVVGLVANLVGKDIRVSLHGVHRGRHLAVAGIPGAGAVVVLAKPDQALEPIGAQRVQGGGVIAVSDGIEAGPGHRAEVRRAETEQPLREEPAGTGQWRW